MEDASPGLGDGRDLGSEAERSQRSSQVSGLGSGGGGAFPGVRERRGG